MGITREAYRHIFDKKPYNKFGNVHTYIDGVHFSSKREAHRYEVLLLLLKAGTITDLELQPQYDFPMGFSYRADFRYKENGKTVVEDYKGFKTDVFILKEKCFKHFYPQLELRIVK
jgi:hypothetical protein